jgi:hypothetical protein
VSDEEQAEDLQRDSQMTATPEEAMRAALNELRVNLHTAIPGIIKSFNPVTQTAVVQIAIRRQFVGDKRDGGGWRDLPPCGDVPCFFPGGAGFVLAFTPQEGDECLLVFSERAVDGWFQSGGVQNPSEYRLHDFSDGFALVGFSSQPKAIPAFFPGDGMELRSRDGTVAMRVDSLGVTLGGPSGGAAPLPAPPFQLLLADPLVVTWLNGVGAFCGVGPFPVTGISLKTRAT